MGGGGAVLDGTGGPLNTVFSLVKSKSGGMVGLAGIGGAVANPRPAGSWTVPFSNVGRLESSLGGGGGGFDGHGILGGAGGGL